MKNNIFKPLLSLLLLSVCTLTQAQDWSLLHKSSALHREVDARYGATIDISGNEAVIGTFSEDTDENGMNFLTEAGAVYVLNFDDGTGEWLASQKLVAQPREESEFFGTDASIDNNFMIVGAKSSDFDENGANEINDAGAAYIFEKIGGIWTQSQKLVANDRGESNFFGSSVSISGDYAIVIASNNGTDENNANQMDNAGAGYIFHNDGGTWSQTQKIVASDRAMLDFFGNAVDMDGTSLVVGARQEDEDSNGLNNINESGSAYVFNLDAAQWIEVSKITSTDRGMMDWFGISVGISGDQIVVGARQEDEDASGINTLNSAGSVYVFENDGANNWSQSQKIVASDRAADDLFGYSVDIFQDQIIVGSRSEDEDENNENTVSKAGSAYIFDKVGSVWSESQKIVANDRHINDYFGASVGLSEGLMMIGSRGNDTDQNDENSLSNSGALYVYTTCVTEITDVPLEICQGDSILIGENYESETGEYIVAIMDEQGCISSTNYQLTVSDYTVETIDIESCEGETVEINGVAYTEDISFVEIGDGLCPDSTYYNIVFNPTLTLSVDIPLCPGDSVLVEGEYYSQTTEFTIQTGETPLGCPEFTNYFISILVPQNQTIEHVLCDGESIIISEEEVTVAGTYPENGQDEFGCDITIFNIVTFNEAEDEEIDNELCVGESITIDGVEITESGSYSEELENEFGCTYTLTHNVTFNELPLIDLGENITVCDTSNFVLDAGNGFASYLWNDNSMDQTLAITETGTYSVTVEDVNGCAASSEIEVTVATCVGIEELSFVELEVYPNPTFNVINFENKNNEFKQFIIYNEQGQMILENTLNNASSIDVSSLANGLYFVDFIGQEKVRKARFIKK